MLSLRDGARPRLARPIAGALPRALLLAVALAACGGDAGSPAPSPTDRPTTAPAATPATMPAGPMSGVGLLGRATYETPPGFVPVFTFDVRGDGWRSIVEPDEFGFGLATPSAARMQALIGVARPVAATADAFADELGASGLLDGSEIVEDVSLDGVASRSFAIDRDTPADAFRIVTANGEVLTSFGGPLPKNRFIFVAHPDGPFVVILSLAPDADVEARFVFDALVGSIAFR
jgi:hypothetical protein